MRQQFINYISNVRGYSPNTVDAYDKDIRHFVRWMQTNQEGARWSTITRQDIDEYMQFMTVAGLSPATINRRLASIATMYKYMKLQGYQVENPCRYESRKKLRKRQPMTIDEATIKQVIATADKRIALAIRLIYTTGLRTSEVLNLKSWDVLKEESAIMVRNGKGGKDRKVFCDAQTLTMLQQECQQHKGIVFNWSPREFRYKVWEAFKPYSDREELNPRTLRHTFATTMARNGANATTIAAMLGHESIKTTQRYIDFAGTAVQEQYLKFKPTVS